MKMNPFLLTDFYKIGHPFQYPKGITKVYSNLTPRKSRINGINEMVFFGLQYFIKQYLIKYFNDNFFNQDIGTLMKQYERRIKNSLGNHLPTYDHIRNLHKLGYLPIKIKALPEGSLVPMRVPCLTIVNTHPEFYWLTNFFETLMSSVLWQPCTSATIGYEYRKLLNHWAKETGMPKDFVQWQAHDFSFRGMSSPESVITSGMAHLLSFTGTDSIPSIDALEQYYNADSDKELIGGSVPATEHAVMCSGSKECEIDTFKRLITEIYPSGIISIVSDTWDLWKVLTEYLPALKEIILARDGKVVIRPDSGDPIDIICGEGYQTNENWGGWHSGDYRKFISKDGFIKLDPDPKTKGVIELLWDVFGGTINEKGYKVLDSHIGAIYGDSITLERANEICKRLAKKGFASQCVFGIGSYTYQYNTRDTFGLAVKATWIEIDGKGQDIFKDPITDDGTKKSATGLLSVLNDVEGKIYLIDKVNKKGEDCGLLETVFEDGKLVRETSLQEIRKTLSDSKL